MVSGVSRLIANHQSLSSSKAYQKSGPFPPPALPGLNGTAAPSDSRPGRHPEDAVDGATAARTGPPPITRNTLPTCRAHYPGEQGRVHASVASPSHAAFPVMQAGRRPHLHFRGLLELHSRYGPPDRSTAPGGLSLRWCSAPSGRTAFPRFLVRPIRTLWTCESRVANFVLEMF